MTSTQKTNYVSICCEAPEAKIFGFCSACGEHTDFIDEATFAEPETGGILRDLTSDLKRDLATTFAAVFIIALALGFYIGVVAMAQVTK